MEKKLNILKIDSLKSRLKKRNQDIKNSLLFEL